MEELLNKIEFEIKDIGKKDDGSNFKVSIKVPKELGKIEGMKFVTELFDERYEGSRQFSKRALPRAANAIESQPSSLHEDMK